MIRRWLLGGLLLVLCVSVVFGKPGVVKTRDGRSIEGDITDKGADGVTIVTRGGTVLLPRADVDSIVYAANIQEQYEQRLAKLPENAGANEHYELARWLYDNKAYDLARKEIDVVLQMEPNNAEAGLFKQIIDRAILWQSGKPAGAADTRDPAAPKVPPPAARKDRNLLDADQINTIRQLELRDTERVNIRFEGDVVRKYMETGNVDKVQFAKMGTYSKAMEIMKSGRPELRRAVRITADPQALLFYKQRVQPAVLSGCATAACHGGANAGTFILHSPANNDALTYTNFYILSQYKVDTAEGERTMIVRMAPDKSPLAQFGLPRDVAEIKHPDVPGFTPTFRSTQDPRYQDLLRWMRDGLIPIPPDYGFEFPVQPKKAPATQPQTDDPAANPPATEAQPEQPAQPQAKDDTQDKLDESRERLKPGRITIPPPVIPF